MAYLSRRKTKVICARHRAKLLMKSAYTSDLVTSVINYWFYVSGTQQRGGTSFDGVIINSPLRLKGVICVTTAITIVQYSEQWVWIISHWYWMVARRDDEALLLRRGGSSSKKCFLLWKNGRKFLERKFSFSADSNWESSTNILLSL